MVITFLPRSKHPLISWLRSPSAMIFGAKIKSVTVSPSICHEVIELDAIILVFWMLSFKPAFWVKTQLYLWGEQLKWLDKTICAFFTILLAESLTPLYAAIVYSRQFRLFLLLFPKFLKFLSITQFQNYFHIYRYLLQQYLTSRQQNVYF